MKEVRCAVSTECTSQWSAVELRELDLKHGGACAVRGGGEINGELDDTLAQSKRSHADKR